MTIFQQRFTTGQVIAAARVTNASLQSWIRRGVIVGQDDGNGIDMPGSPGIRRSFSFYGLMQIAVGKALLDNGMDVQPAFLAAAKFAHTGSQDRFVSLPWPGVNRTLLCAGGGRSTVVEWKPGTDVMTTIRSRLGGPESFATVFINDVFDRVCESLSLHPEAVLEAAYKAANK